MFSDLHKVQWEPVSATKTYLMFCGIQYKQWEPAFSKNFGPQLEAFKLLAMAMVGHAMDRVGLNDSKNASNCFFSENQPDRILTFWC